jgi:hypothetical protein
LISFSNEAIATRTLSFTVSVGMVDLDLAHRAVCDVKSREPSVVPFRYGRILPHRNRSRYFVIA